MIRGALRGLLCGVGLAICAAGLVTGLAIIALTIQVQGWLEG